MVHIEDMGSQFDAPIELIWKLNTGPEHADSHAARRNIHGEPNGPNGMKLSWEQNVEGNWVKVSNEVTMFPPVAMLVHSKEGPLAGSRFLMFYKPNGAKTGVSVVGDFQSAVIPAAHLEQMVLKSLGEAFDEDNATLRRMGGHA